MANKHKNGSQFHIFTSLGSSNFPNSNLNMVAHIYNGIFKDMVKHPFAISSLFHFELLTKKKKKWIPRCLNKRKSSGMNKLNSEDLG